VRGKVHEINVLNNTLGQPDRRPRTGRKGLLEIQFPTCYPNTIGNGVSDTETSAKWRPQ